MGQVRVGKKGKCDEMKITYTLPSPFQVLLFLPLVLPFIPTVTPITKKPWRHSKIVGHGW